MTVVELLLAHLLMLAFAVIAAYAFINFTPSRYIQRALRIWLKGSEATQRKVTSAVILACCLTGSTTPAVGVVLGAFFGLVWQCEAYRDHDQKRKAVYKADLYS
jgi:hypothetical protein